LFVDRNSSSEDNVGSASTHSTAAATAADRCDKAAACSSDRADRAVDTTTGNAADETGASNSPVQAAAASIRGDNSHPSSHPSSSQSSSSSAAAAGRTSGDGRHDNSSRDWRLSRDNNVYHRPTVTIQAASAATGPGRRATLTYERAQLDDSVYHRPTATNDTANTANGPGRRLQPDDNVYHRPTVTIQTASAATGPGRRATLTYERAQPDDNSRHGDCNGRVNYGFHTYSTDV